jgi:hypothetical protein
MGADASQCLIAAQNGQDIEYRGRGCPSCHSDAEGLGKVAKFGAFLLCERPHTGLE